MKKIVNILFPALLILGGTYIFSSCVNTKNLVNNTAAIKKLYDAGNYSQALKQAKETIASYEKSGKENQCPVYTIAGKAAMNLGDTVAALEYFKKAEYSVSLEEETFLGLAACYNHKDNLSKEMMALQDYLAKFPNGKYAEDVKKQLFSIYIQSKNYDKALKLWPEIKKSVENEPAFLVQFFEANQALKNTQTCDSLAPVIMDFHPDNIKILEYEAKKYFDKAEKLYGTEMKAYEKNRTNKQYKHLLKALNVVSADFNTALKYYKKLYTLKPKPEYAKALAHIYKRLDNNTKSLYYQKLSHR